MNRKDKLGEIRSRLHIDDMDIEARKQLFEDFQKKGGKVVSLDHQDERKKTRIANESDRKMETLDELARSSKVGDHNIKAVQAENPFEKKVDPKRYMQARLAKKKTTKKKSARYHTWFSLWFLRLKCYFCNIFNFSASRFSKAFMQLVSKEMYDSLSEMKFALDPIFKNPTKEGLEFRKMMYSKDLLEDYEMVYHTYNMIDEILRFLLTTPLSESVVQSELQIKKIYALLYPLYQYTGYTRAATPNIAMLFVEQFPQVAYHKLARAAIANVLYLIWNVLYIKLDILIQYYWVSYNKSNDYKSLRQYLGLENFVLDIGVMAQTWKNEYFIEENDEEDTQALNEGEDSPSLFPDDSIERGVHFICSKVDFVASYQIFRNGQDTRRLFAVDDCLFYTYVLVDFFDSEFAFLWTGDTMNYYVTFDPRTNMRIDIRKEMQSQHSKISHFYELVNEYLRMIKASNSLKRNSGMKLNDDKRETDISRSSFAARQVVFGMYEKYKDILRRIIQSQSTSDPLVGNFDTVISTHKEKIFDGSTIKDAILHASDYVDAVIWLIRYSDLSGLHYRLRKPKIFQAFLESLEEALYNQDQQ